MASASTVRFRTLVHSDLYTRQCDAIGDARRMDDALLLFQGRLSTHPEHGRQLGTTTVWALITQRTTPEFVVYYQFNDDCVYLLGIRPVD